MLGLPSVPEFDTYSDPSSIGTRWQTWTNRFDIYIAAAEVKDDKQKTALLLQLAGFSVQKILKGLAPGGKKFADIAKALSNHFLPKKNVR